MLLETNHLPEMQCVIAEAAAMTKTLHQLVGGGKKYMESNANDLTLLTTTF